MMYNELVETYFFAPQHVGTIEELTPYSAHFRAKQANLTDLLDLYLLCDASGFILKALFKAFGNPYLIAGAEWLCRQLEKTKLDSHPCFNYLTLIEVLEIPKTNMAAAIQIDEAYKAIISTMKMNLERNHHV